MSKEIQAFKVAGAVLLSLVITVLAFASMVSFGSAVIYQGEDTLDADFKYENGVNLTYINGTLDSGYTDRYTDMQERNDANVVLLNVFAGVISTMLGLFSLAILLLVLRSFTGAGGKSSGSY
jgi:hypothetical protein